MSQAMKRQPIREAWVEIPSAEAVPGRPSGYNFGFRSAMGRLIGAHEGIDPKFGALFKQIMFEPGSLSRREREMVSAVAAAGQDCYY